MEGECEAIEKTTINAKTEVPLTETKTEDEIMSNGGCEEVTVNGTDVGDQQGEVIKNGTEIVKDTEILTENVINGDVEKKTDDITHAKQESITENEDARSVDSVGGEAAAGSDSGVEGCVAGSRSCASSVVSDASSCPPRPRRRTSAITPDPPRRPPPTTPRGPALATATRDRARSREKPALPEKPRPLTPKPRLLPSVIRESPALRAKPTKTSTARCRTPASPTEENKWMSTSMRASSSGTEARLTADKYGTLPRRRRDETESSPKHEAVMRRSTVTRSVSTRTTTKTRVRIYAEKNSQTVLLGTDVEAALAGLTPNIESVSVTKSSVGVQASGREELLSRAVSAETALEEERALRLRAEERLAEERAAATSLHENTKRLLELAGNAPGAVVGTDACLKALEEQLKASAELATRQQAEIDSLREHNKKLHKDSIKSREYSRSLEVRLEEAEREAVEMQEFLAAETGALSDSLREAEAENANLNTELDRRRAECRQLVRVCEQRRQEALSAAARARGLDTAARRLARLHRALSLIIDHVATVGHARDAYHHYSTGTYSRSDSGEALTPDESVSRRFPRLEDVSDNDSADLLDSETEPCLVEDPDLAEEWCSGAELSCDVSPVRECVSLEGEVSLRSLSAAIAQRQRSELEETDRGDLLRLVHAIDTGLAELMRTLQVTANGDTDKHRELNDKSMADTIVKKLTELDATKMMEHYRQTVEVFKKLLADTNEESLDFIVQELVSCNENERHLRYQALEEAVNAHEQINSGRSPKLDALRNALEQLTCGTQKTLGPTNGTTLHSPA